MIAHVTEIRFAHLSYRLGLGGIDGFGFATDTHDIKFGALTVRREERRWVATGSDDTSGHDAGCSLFKVKRTVSAANQSSTRSRWKRPFHSTIHSPRTSEITRTAGRVLLLVFPANRPPFYLTPSSIHLRTTRGQFLMPSYISKQ